MSVFIARGEKQLNWHFRRLPRIVGSTFIATPKYVRININHERDRPYA